MHVRVTLNFRWLIKIFLLFLPSNNNVILDVRIYCGLAIVNLFMDRQYRIKTQGTASTIVI